MWIYNIDNGQIGNSGGEILAAHLKDIPNLEKLNLCELQIYIYIYIILVCNKLESIGGHALAKNLKYIPKLKTVILCRT